MDKEQVFTILKQNIVDVVPELANRTITLDDSLRELGANSIDRAEILIKTMASLRLHVPLIDFGHAKNINELVTIFLEKLKTTEIK